jgi:hypothetical protein
MLRLLNPFRSARRPAPQIWKAHLSVEQLEDRFCPATPVVDSLSAVHIGTSLAVAGHVSDQGATTVNVALTGATSAQVVADSFGNFVYICDWSGGTTVTGQATDNQNQTSSQVNATISAPTYPNPMITLSVSYGTGKTITLSGRVADTAPSGLTVTFSGAATGTATTDANGNFSATLTANSLGTVSAFVRDSTNQISNTANVTLTCAKPVIQNFYCSEQADGSYLFTGNVVAPSVTGLTVNFGGAPVSLQNQTATVLANGTFALQLPLNGQTSDNGTAMVTVTDCWGQTSTMGLCNVLQTGVG